MEGMWSNSGKWKTFDDNPEPIIPYRVKVKPKKDEDIETKLRILVVMTRNLKMLKIWRKMKMKRDILLIVSLCQ
ncbi:hypothetical protein RRG08_032400 [Elysia crispata]|uniref:Uncharacterized protein n=1 Tax=Elysia crispata TaxID=231223 RepID=A0AAE1CPP3_9GAST|nr:hypothetical protein RRG08_032400 [Elysia crispata]